MSKLSMAKRVLCSFLAAAMILSVSACGKTNKNEKEGDKSNIARQIVNYYAPKTIPLPDGLEYAENIKCANGNIYLSGYASGSSADNITKIINLETKAVEDIDLSMIECSYISKTLMTEDKIYISYSDPDYSTKLCTIDRATNKILKDVEIGNDTYISSMFINSDGKLCALSMNYTSMKPVTTYDIYDENLAVSETINISEKVNLENDTELGMLIPDKKGSYYAVSVNYSSDTMEMALYKLSSTFDVEYSTDELTDMGEFINSLFLNKSGNLCAAGYDYNTHMYLVNEFDPASGAVLERYEFEAGDEDSGSAILGDGAAANYDFLFTDVDGIYGYSFADKTKTNVVKYGEDIPDDFKNCYNASIQGNEIIMNAQAYGSTGQQIYIIDMNGEVKQTIAMPQTDGYIDRMTVAGNGMIYAVETIDNGTEDEDGNYINNPSYKLIRIDENGEVQKEIELDEFELEGDNKYLQSMSVSDDGKAFLGIQSYSSDGSSDKSALVIVDADGKKLAEIASDDIRYIYNVISTKEADYISYESSKGSKITKIDYEKGSLGEELKLKSFGDIDSYRIYSGSENYDFYYSTSDAVYGCSIKDDKVTEIINWIDSDIAIRSDTICPIDENTMVCSSWDESSNGQVLNILERVDEETLKKIQSREIITVAGVDVMYSDIADEIREFNKSNDKYRLQVNDYGKYSSYEEDNFISGANKMNTDIAAGDIPDIVIGGYEVDMESYIAKGMFTDLNKYIESDSEIKREDYLENIFDMYSNDGKLCQLVTNFNISSLIGKSSEVGKEPGWNFDDFFKFVDGKSGKNIFFKTSRSELLKAFISNNLSEFVDFDKKTCDFNNEKMVKILEFIKENGDEDQNEDNGIYGSSEDDYKNYEKRFYDKKCSLELMDLYGFDEYNRIQTMIVQEEITPIGIPTSEGNGALISSSGSIGISEKSEKKDAAWQFVRVMLLDKYQDGLNGSGYVSTFPVKKSSLDKLIKIAQSFDQMNKGGYYEDFEGNEMEMKPIDTESAEKILNLAKNATRSVVSDSHLTDIIEEQVDTFFSDGQSAQEAAEAIQSKSALYLKEIS